MRTLKLLRWRGEAETLRSQLRTAQADRDAAIAQAIELEAEVTALRRERDEWAAHAGEARGQAENARRALQSEQDHHAACRRATDEATATMRQGRIEALARIKQAEHLAREAREFLES